MSDCPPVLLTVWRRPDATARVLAAIRAARPKQLFVASDGPRDGTDDAALVTATRRLVEEVVDWDCEVATLHRERNLGCRRAMAGGLDWFFSRVEEGIVLEDDCVPHPDFFGYCAELLERYRDDPRVMHIGGDNSAGVTWDGPDSYRFVRWPMVWGWATWRRAWLTHDRDLVAWSEAVRGRRARRVLPDPVDREVWIPLLERLRVTDQPDSWAYRWVATVVRQGGLAVLPRVNLISNVGFGQEATHTTDAEHPRADRASAPILPLRHPPTVEWDPTADRLLLERTGGRLKAARRVAERRSLQGRMRRADLLIRRILGPIVRPLRDGSLVRRSST